MEDLERVLEADGSDQERKTIIMEAAVITEIIMAGKIKEMGNEYLVKSAPILALNNIFQCDFFEVHKIEMDRNHWVYSNEIFFLGYLVSFLKPIVSVVDTSMYSVKSPIQKWDSTVCIAVVGSLFITNEESIVELVFEFLLQFHGDSLESIGAERRKERPDCGNIRD